MLLRSYHIVPLRFLRGHHGTLRSSTFLRHAHTGKSEVPALYKPRRETWFHPFLILVGVMPFFACSLGIWQINRLKWKVNLIDELEEKLQLPPFLLPSEISTPSLTGLVYRKVLVKGVWDHEHTMILRPRVHLGSHGVHVITPLRREDGTTILVDRGFVSNENLNTMAYNAEPSVVEVKGMIRTSQARNRFTPNNHPEEGIWYWTDIDAMADYAGGQRNGVKSIFLEQIFEGSPGDAAYRLSAGEPLGREPTVDIRNAHFSYVVTWFSLSAFTTFMFFRLLRNKRRSIGRKLPRYT